MTFRFLIQSAKSACYALALVLLSTSLAQAQAYGSCAGNDFGSPGVPGSIAEDGRVVRGGLEQVVVIEANAPLRSAPTEVGSVISDLTFGDRFNLVRKSGEYFEITADSRNQNALSGWVRAEYLMCRTRPIVSRDTGLEQKFYIKTEAAVQDGEVKTVSASSSVSGEKSCDAPGMSCRELSRFSLYYVFAVDFEKRRLFLMDDFETRGAVAIGWVDEEDGFLWETRYGLRPKEDLVYEADDTAIGVKAGDEKFICVHEDLDSALKSDNSCDLPVLGGDRWFKLALRIPVLQRVPASGSVPAYYKVVLPVAGVGGEASADLYERIDQFDRIVGSLKSLQKLDVFFLIDGTQSMGPHLDAVLGRESFAPGVIGAIQQAFEDDPRFAGTDVRYGFRVYRDLYDGQLGIGEGLPLGSNCNPSEDERLESLSAFQSAVREVDENFGSENSKGDDHEENLHYGILKAVEAMSGCEDHTKLLFIIADTGYSKEAQEKRGAVGLSDEQAAAFLTLNFDEENESIIPYFVQVPKNPKNLNKPDYNKAYGKFETQARRILQSVLRHMSEGTEGARTTSVDQHFFSMRDRSIPQAQRDIVEEILNNVALLGDARPINEIIAELNGGTALVEIITRLQQDDRYGNLPGVRLAQIERRLCEQLGPGCQQRTYNVIQEGVILESDDLEVDVWMSSDELRKWEELLSKFEKFANKTVDELAELILKQLLTMVENTVGDTTVQEFSGLSPDDVDQSIARFISRSDGLPVSEKTPLLNYTLGDLMAVADSGEDGNPSEPPVGVCELNLLADWLDKRRSIFDDVRNDRFPVFEVAITEDCETRHELKRVLGYTARRFDDPSMSFQQAIGDRDGIFWVPERFLP